MKIFGIKLVPLNEPLEYRLQALAAGIWFITSTFLGFILLFILLYLLTTSFWWISFLYLSWMYIDRNKCETGGRPIKWIQKLPWWRYVRNYFSTSLRLAPDFELDPKRNYLFCCFPHGVLPAGPFTGIATESSEFKKLYPQFTVTSPALRVLFLLPIVRELGMGVGGISCSAQSLLYILTRPEGGYIANLIPGGAAEAVYAKPGKYKLVLKKRKGFVKIALKAGAPLVPVLTFGETDLFDQIDGPNIRKVQEAVKKFCGFTPVLFLGRGFLQESFGAIPRKRHLTTVVGKPIDVEKVENPSEEQVDQLHKRFTEDLVSLFEKYKHEYLDDPENTFLEFA